MVKYTRKQRGRGLLNMFSGKSKKQDAVQRELNSLEAQKQYALRHRQSRAANVLSKPGTVMYTNKERIEKEFAEKVKDIVSQIEQPEATVSALETVSAKLQSAIQSQAARETGAVVLTLPVGIAQLFLKAVRAFLAVLIFVFGLAPSMMGAESAVAEVTRLAAPNSKFNTTAAAYKAARKFTGANTNSNSVIVSDY